MTSRRTAKVAEAIRQVVSSAILFELKDPRVKNVTVLYVDVAADLRSAKVYLSILGDEKTEKLTMGGLNSARGWIQSRIADHLNLRHTPILHFVVDYGVKKSIEVSKTLREIQAEQAGLEDDSTDADDSPDTVAQDEGEEGIEAEA